MAVKIEKKFDLKRIRFDFSKELNLAGQIIRKDHVTRLEKGQGVDGGQLKELKTATIKRKGFNQILVETGKMRKLAFRKADKKRQFVELFPDKRKNRNGVSNQQIGFYHQTGAGNLPERKWFGISKQAEKDSIKFVELKIEQELNRA